MAEGEIFNIELDYPVAPVSRWSYPARPNSAVSDLFVKQTPNFVRSLEKMACYKDYFLRINDDENAESCEPNWMNIWIPPLDAMSIYSAIATEKPRHYFEVGSGISTKFARRAIRDFSLNTRIISIDPSPRAEVDILCDQVVRNRLEDCNLEREFRDIASGDILFIDGSHRCLQNSDATVFFLELLWRLPKNVLVGVHDIFLPYDYPSDWVGRFYSEQYLLAAMLLGDQGHNITVELPNFYAFSTGLSERVLKPVWSELKTRNHHHGGCLWLRFGGP